MFHIRSAKTADVAAITKIAQPLVAERVLLGKELVAAYESIQEFIVAERDGEVIGFGALHVMWQDLAEVRTLAVAEGSKRQGIGAALLAELESRARDLGIKRRLKEEPVLVLEETNDLFRLRELVLGDLDRRAFSRH